MFSFDQFSRRLATQIGEILGLDPGRREVVGYGLALLLHNLAGLAAVLVIAYFLGALPSTAALALTLLLLRPSAGGAHCGSSFNCSIFGYLFMPLLGLGASWLASRAAGLQLGFLGAAFLVALSAMVKNAPYLTREKPRAAARRRYLKIRALLLAVLISALSMGLLFWGWVPWSMGLAAGLLFQGLMLLPAGIYCVHWFDILVNTIITKLGGEPQ